jgi:alpha-N-arabinofuranosidase
LEKGTYYSDLRATYGNKKPFNVKYWCLGNEVDGSPWIMGYKNAEDYCKIAREAAKAMKAIDNTIKFVACGSSYYESTGKWVDWNWKVISELRDIADYVSIHRYWERSDDYYIFMGQSAMDIEEKIKVPAAQIEVVKAMFQIDNPIYLSVDEWAPFGRNLLSVLAVAQYFNSFIRHADVVKMANFTLLTSLLQEDREKGSFKTPLFHTFKLFSNNCLGNSIDAYVECDTFNTEKFKGIPFLDVTAVHSKETKTVFVNVVNRHKDKGITADIINSSGVIEGKAEARLVNSDSLKEFFTFGKQERYIPVTKAIEVEGNKVSFSFPPHSFTQIKVAVKK